MSTKDDYLFFKDKHLFNTSFVDQNVQQFSNLNLNEIHSTSKVSSVQSFSNTSCDTKQYEFPQSNIIVQLPQSNIIEQPPQSNIIVQPPQSNIIVQSPSNYIPQPQQPTFAYGPPPAGALHIPASVHSAFGPHLGAPSNVNPQQLPLGSAAKRFRPTIRVLTPPTYRGRGYAQISPQFRSPQIRNALPSLRKLPTAQNTTPKSRNSAISSTIESSSLPPSNVQPATAVEEVIEVVDAEDDTANDSVVAKGGSDIKKIKSLETAVKKLTAENSKLRDGLNDCFKLVGDLGGKLESAVGRIGILENKVNQRRDQVVTSQVFNLTPELSSAVVQIEFLETSFQFPIKDFVTNGMGGKVIEEVAKLIALKMFERMMPEGYNYYDFSTHARSATKILIPAFLFSDLVEKLILASTGESDPHLKDTILCRINYALRDKINRETRKRSHSEASEAYETSSTIRAGETNREALFAAGSRNSFLKRSQIISRQQQQPTTQAPQQQQINFGTFEDHGFISEDFDNPEPQEETVQQPTVSSRQFADPPITNEYLQRTVITAHAVKANLSGNGIEDVMLMMKTLFHNQLVVTSKDIQREMDNWLAEFGLKEKIFCAAKDCKKSFSTVTSQCPCNAPKDEKAIVSTASVIPQIVRIVKKYEDELFKPRIPSNKRYDLKDYMHCNFDPNCLELELIINTDGVQPKQNSRKPFHPIFLCIKNLGGPIRSSINNIVLSGIITGLKTPPEWLLEIALQQLHIDMELLKSGIQFVRKNGESVMIKAKITDTVVDQIASQIVYQHCSHAAHGYGCTECDVFPIREANAQRWPLKSGKLRAEDNNRVGLAVVDTAFCKLAPESLIRLDGLHILDEGLCKTLLQLLSREFKIFEDIRKEINRSMLKTGAGSLNLKGNAHELRKLFTFVIPLLFVAEKEDSRIQAAVLFWLLCRLLYSKYLNTAIIDEIAPLFEELGEAMEKQFGNSFKTIKGHKFFGHGGEELKFHGTPADFSAAVFECANRLLKLLISPYNTRGFDRSLQKKHLQHTVIESKIEQMTTLLNLNPDSYAHLYSNSSSNYVSNSVRYKGELLPLMNEGEMAFFSVRRNAFTFKFNPSKNIVSYVKATLSGIGSCFKVFVGVERNGEKYLICKKLTTFNPIAANSFCADLQQIATVLLQYQSIVFQIGDRDENSEFILIPLKSVVSFILLIEFQSHKFLIDPSERYNKT